MTKRKKNSTGIIIAFLFIFMFILAVTSTVIGVLIPKMQEDYSLTYEEISYLSSIQNVGGFIVMLIGSVLADRFSKLRLIGICVMLYTASLFLIGIVPPYFLLLTLFFVVGAMVNGLSMLVSAYISESCKGNAVSYLNLSHGFYGIGCLVGPVYATILFSLNLRWTVLYVTLAVTCTVLLIIYFVIMKKNKEAKIQGVKEKEQEQAVYKDLFKNRRFIYLCIACCIFMGQQTAFSTWITSYTLNKVTDQVALANTVTSLYWLGIAIGRLGQPIWARNIEPVKTVAVGCFISAILSSMGILSGNIVVLLIMTGVSGICSGAAFPNLIGAGGMVFPNMTGAATSVICLSGSIGGIVFPWLMAKVISASYLKGIMIAPVALLLTSLILFRFLAEERSCEK